VDAVAAFLDEGIELFDPRLAAVIELARRSRPKAARSNRENQGAEGLSVFVIEGTVDEDVFERGGAPPANRQSSARGLSARTTRRTSSREIEAPFAAGFSTAAPVTGLRPSDGARLDLTLRATVFFFGCAFIVHMVSEYAHRCKDLSGEPLCSRRHVACR
jgi:hypothetical protein